MWQAVDRLIELGGPVVVILLVLSVIGLAIALVKTVQLQGYSDRRFRALVRRLETQGDTAMEGPGPLAELCRYALDPGSAATSMERLEAELSRRGARLVSQCSGYLRPLELIAYLAPLLGLLGTVLGMIEAFQGLESQDAGGDAGLLAGGIWEALLTTALGLGIAIPLTAAHALLEARVQRIAEALGDLLELCLLRR